MGAGETIIFLFGAAVFTANYAGMAWVWGWSSAMEDWIERRKQK